VAALYGERCLQCVQRPRSADLQQPLGLLYHGTYHDFDKLRLNANGVLWLTPNPVVAAEYGSPYYSKRDTAIVWRVKLKPTAKVVELDDLSHPAVRALFENQNVRLQSSSPFGARTEQAWRQVADFGLLEERGAIPFLKGKRVDAVTVKRDTLGTTPIPHDSVALLRLSAIESADKTTLPRSRSDKTIGQIQKDVEAWRA
jgi:hypothetical protein